MMKYNNTFVLLFIAIWSNMATATGLPDCRYDIDLYVDTMIEYCENQQGNNECEYLSCDNVDHIPTTIGDIPSLKYIFVVGQISELPTEIGKLVNLRTMQIYGSIIETLPKEFEQLSNLKEFGLSSDKMKKVPETIPTGIHTLRISGDLISQIPSGIFHPNLRDLHIDVRNYNKQLKEIEKLTDLETLYLHHNYKSIPNLSKLQNLNSLVIENKELTNLPNTIGKLTQLEELTIEAPLKKLPTSMKNLVNLDRLSLVEYAKTTLPDFILENLIELNSLEIRDSKLAKIPQLAENGPKLNDFILNGAELKDTKAVSSFNINLLELIHARLEEFPTISPSLENIDLSYNQIETVPSEIGELSEVWGIILDHNPIAAIPTEIGGCSKLYSLSIENTEVAVIPDEISTLTNLNNFHANGAKLSALPLLGELYQIQIANNSFSAIPRTAFAARKVELSGNNIGAITEEDLPDKDIPGSCKIFHLALQDNKLVSIHPELFAICSSLRILELDNNNFDNAHWNAADVAISSTIGTLSLSGNQFTSIPVPLPGEVRWLSMASNFLEAIPDLSSNDLYFLDLSDNQIDADLDAENFPLEIEVLNLANNEISTIYDTFLSTLKELYRLYLDSNALSELPADFFYSDSRLEELGLSDNMLETIPSGIAKLTQLETLDISFNKFDHIPAEILETRSIRNFNISWNSEITDVSGVSTMPLLFELDISGLQWSDLTLPDFSSFTLHDLHATDAGLNNIPKLPATIELINFSNNNIKKVPADLFLKHRKLEDVYLANNKIRSLPNSLFSKLDYDGEVDELDFSNNQLSKFPKLHKMHSLDRLHVAYNNLKSVPDGIELLRSLDVLDLRGNRIKRFSSDLLPTLVKHSLDEFYIKQRVNAKYPCSWAGYLRHLKATDLTVEDLDC